MRTRTIPLDRKCFKCGSSETYKKYNRNPVWYRFLKDDQFICNKCRNNLVTNPKWNSINSPITNPRRIAFKGRRVHLGYNPRTGTCSRCKRSVKEGDIKFTHIHHDLYDPNNPLANTRELCASCHAKHHAGTLV